MRSSVKSALDNSLQVLSYFPADSSMQKCDVLRNIDSQLISDIRDIYAKNDSLSCKLYAQVTLDIEKGTPGHPNFKHDLHFINTPVDIFTLEEIPVFKQFIVAYTVNNLENSFSKLEGSGWRAVNIAEIKVHVCRINSYSLRGYAAYPSYLRGVHNVYNPDTDQNCVLIALASFKKFIKTPSVLPKNLTRDIKRRGSKYWREELDIGALDPSDIQWADLDVLERKNNININIYNLHSPNHSHDNNQDKINSPNTHTLHLARRSRCKYKTVVSLLLLNNNHICLIRNLISYYKNFTRKQISIPFLCPYCLTIFKNQDASNNHTENCNAHVTVNYPPPSHKIEFSRMDSLYPMPFASFLDFEALNIPSESNSVISTQSSFAYNYTIVNVTDSENPQIVKKNTYFGLDSVTHMINNLSRDAAELLASCKHPINVSKSDFALHKSKLKCDVCSVKFTTKTPKVLHHYHHMRENNYAGTLCSNCNLLLRQPKYMPVIVHNLSYDLTLILKEAHPNIEIEVNKKEGFRFYSAKIKNLRFIDSCNMLQGSLSSLASEHIKNRGPLSITKSMLGHLPDDVQNLLLSSGKQILPYEYFDCIDKLDECSVPRIEAFYSHLSESHISLSDYNHVCEIWNKANCQTLKDYVKIYLELDVSLLADVYLQWRSTLLSAFKLDCLYFLTLASYAIQACYLDTGVKLDAISDPTLYDLINRNIRGGFTSVGKRHVKANNKHTNARFNPSQDTSNYLFYCDFNSLYPTCMSTYKVPSGDFVLLNPDKKKEFLNQDLLSIDTQGERGYFIHCKICPVDEHVIYRTDEFPLILSEKKINASDISPYSKSLLDKMNVKLTSENSKLVAHHEGVDDCLLTLPYLQFLLKKGVKLDTVYRVYSFKQEYVFKEFIDKNILRRARESNPFLKTALKLINNAIYGRTLLNPLNYATFTKVVNDGHKLVKSFTKPNFKSVDLVSQNRCLVTCHKTCVTVSSPIYIGFSILDFAKITMYSFFYDVLKAQYGDRVEFVYSDTDSFIINLKTEDLDEELKGPLAAYMDLSNYPPDHDLYNDQSKGKLGLLKNETPGDYIIEFVAIKPKAYTFTTVNNLAKCNVTLKGVGKVIKSRMTISDFKSCLYTGNPSFANVYQLGFSNQNMSLKVMSKKITSCYEDKRFYIDALTSYGYGHPIIKTFRQAERREMSCQTSTSCQLPGKKY